jgi:SAM-dependent methyltransferase
MERHEDCNFGCKQRSETFEKAGHVGISQTLRRHYENSYAEDNPVMAEGRKIGAERKAENIIRLCSPFPHARILEIGAGDGSVLLSLKRRGFGQTMTALEISDSAVRKLQALNLSELGVESFDGSRVPFGSNSFDIAILTHVVEHLENPRQLIKESARVAKYVYVEVPCEDNRGVGKDWLWNPEGHINYYTPRSIRFLVQSCGLHVHAQRTMDWALRTYIFENGPCLGVIKCAVKRTAMFLPIRHMLFTYNASIVASDESIQ